MLGRHPEAGAIDLSVLTLCRVDLDGSKIGRSALFQTVLRLSKDPCSGFLHCFLCFTERHRHEDP